MTCRSSMGWECFKKTRQACFSCTVGKRSTCSLSLASGWVGEEQGQVKRKVGCGSPSLPAAAPRPQTEGAVFPEGPRQACKLASLFSDRRGLWLPAPGPPVRMTSVLRDIRQSAFLRWVGKAITPWQRAWPGYKVASLEQSPCYRVLLGLCLS